MYKILTGPAKRLRFPAEPQQFQNEAFDLAIYEGTLKIPCSN